MARKSIDWSKVTAEMSSFDKKSYGDKKEDLNLFQPKVKDDGTYDAIIRFLPSPDTDLPYVLVYNHGYQGPKGKWLIENCPRSIDHKCPVCDNASKTWASGDEEGARKRFKKFSAYVNIVVIKDPQNPDNEGKVFIYRLGKKMFELIKSKMIPPSPLDEPLMVFDYDIGANFKLKIRSKTINDAKGNKKSVPNYDSSEFTAPVKLGDDKFIDQIDANLLPLKGYITEDKFLSFSALQKKVNEVEGREEEVDETRTSDTASARTSAPAPKKAASVDDEDDNSFFERMRNGT